ncbi:peptidyl-prolyl cis-trans isomerase [Sulfitobacter pseudonitzschiae]|uniref:Peptidyl-prolyl cis-trans isomerase n=1 Tax=Pseudosulfitobacter pseudonitzschiae TaxID=1402135 RepID=A0A9Q2RUJ0_9RHOB|nr:peptidylprolyl isomerase [Pseudosulfitobacter pseudonitzschiae]MBM2291192.1 peptidyl-prolyl cis-trans isomerase [Pseudosulfitobacter pseudonitzschiae]MBM2296110.1 peptidyl-prolyl cis-trans isomerase [Pseudosulfitobacter pseudonitzschiae]MBM2301023.1 peptidyl-prolyl cis-trans isomerase [Pseudosulfitobacter pseudonitzschiae]MBM2310807.1 peptidyl-prolyl cis-trans isomerase [Pseudosulfitobacter pseudonitzschiae]MBM2315720.1 peptidyl-prolyl cis-trans isomerase [Pseudosulfitobacter pseudonitzschi
MAARTKNMSKTAVWILMAMLILGLGGFGATNLSGTLRTLGTVGDKHIDIDQYAQQLNQTIRAYEAQTGQQLSFAQAQAMGLDQSVLQRLVSQRALDNETDKLGLSIGDASLRDEILQIREFRGVDGQFNREGYRMALESSGLSESEFETQLREEAARTLLQGAIASGVVMPDTYAKTLVDYVGEARNFTWSRLQAEDLETPVAEPTEDEMRAFLTEHQADYQRPETKTITYALLTPDMLVDSVEVDAADLQKAYEARADEYQQPERRLVERLPFLDQEAADRAAAALEMQGTTFEQLVQDRGLALADVDMGDMSLADLGSAGEAIFAAEVGDVVGPLPSDLGPALFRVNGVLPAHNTTFEQAEPELRATLAADRARRQVDAQSRSYDDMLAGGATLEDLAKDSDMTLGTIDWFDGSDDAMAGYTEFREAAAAVTQDDYPEIETLSDGGIFALRLDKVTPARDATFDEAREDIAADMIAQRTEAALSAKAEELLPQLKDGAGFADLGLDSIEETDQVRSAFIQNTPRSFVAQVFEMEPGDVNLVTGQGMVVIVRLDDILPAADNAEATALQAQLVQQMNQSLSQDILDIYTADTTVRARPQIDQRAVQAVHVNFP